MSIGELTIPSSSPPPGPTSFPNFIVRVGKTRIRAVTPAGPEAVRKTQGRLADGREIFYFDEDDDAVRPPVDERRLPEPPAAPVARFDVLSDEWVAVAAHRQDRTYLPTADQCPLCPSAPGRPTEIPATDYHVVVFENRFPSFASPGAGSDSPVGHEEAVAPGAGAPGELLTQRLAGGRCEVVCFTSEHDSAFSRLPARRVRTVVEAWVDRTVALSELPAVAQVFCFENRGPEIGVTLTHPHGQIYGYPFVAPRTERMLAAAGRYRARTGRSLFGDVLAAEVAAGERVVARSEHWTAFVPYAARWPVEVHLYANQRAAWLPELTDDQRRDFCDLYLDVLRRLEAVHGADVPYVSAWHQAPVRVGRDLAWLHLEISSVRRAPGRLKYLAGSETAMGAYVNDVVPEQAARALRQADVRSGA
jgi:UDPglucose--hexose-1-phosphate uridylyltransferase